MPAATPALEQLSTAILWGSPFSLPKQDGDGSQLEVHLPLSLLHPFPGNLEDFSSLTLALKDTKVAPKGAKSFLRCKRMITKLLY